MKVCKVITFEQCRAARGLLGILQSDLAAQTGLSIVSISSFEKGGAMRKSNNAKVREALEKLGVEFIPENGGGAGVRLQCGSKSNTN